MRHACSRHDPTPEALFADASLFFDDFSLLLFIFADPASFHDS